ncbi:MAG: CHAT domain-containing protein [Acidobacteriota bacterium]
MGATVECRIRPGETVEHPIHLERDEYIEVHLDRIPDHADLFLDAPAPGAASSFSTIGSGEFCAEPRGQTLWGLAREEGVHRLRVSLLPAGEPGPYRIEILTLHPAGEAEWARVAGQKAWDEAIDKLDAGLHEEALAHFDEALDRWTAAGYLRGIAAVHGRQGLALSGLGRLEDTVEALEQAVDAWDRAGSPSGVFANLLDLAQAQADLNLWDEAERSLDRAQNAMTGEEDEEDTGYMFGMICEVDRMQGRTEQAIEACLEATEIFDRLQDPQAALGALLNLGLMHRRMGELERALGYYERVLEILEESPNPRREATIQNNLGILYENLGRFEDALLAHQKAMEMYEGQGNMPQVAMQLFHIGTIHQRTGNLEDTLAYYERARELQSQVRATDELVRTLLGLGGVHLQLGNLDAARRPLREALELSRKSETEPLISRSLEKIGELRLAEGQPEEALELLHEALVLERRAHNRWSESRVLALSAEAYRRMGRPERTLETLRQAAALNEEIGHHSGLGDNYYRIARALRDEGDLEGARNAIQQALALADLVRQRIDTLEIRSLIGATHQSYYEFYISLLMQQHAQDPEAGHDVEALRTAERARVRSLLEVLAKADLGLSDRIPPELLEERERIREGLAVIEQRRAQLLREADDSDQLDLFRVKLDLDHFLTDLADVEQRMRAASPSYGALTRPEPVTVGEIQNRILDPYTALLEFRLGENGSFLFAVTAEGFETFELPPREELEEDARCLHWLITTFDSRDPDDLEDRSKCLRDRAERFERPPVREAWQIRNWRRRQVERAFRERASELSGKIFGQAEEEGFLDGRRLVVVPDGALEYVPFAALPHPRTGEALLRELEVVDLPSASFLAFHRRHSAEDEAQSGTLAIIADPVYGPGDERIAAGGGTRDGAENRGSPGPHYPRLDFASDEAHAIAAFAPAEGTFIALGADATRETVLGHPLDDYRYVHFATHGVIDTRYPQLSRLVLSLVDETGRSIGDGSIRLHDIYGMELDADMVVLSACKTALGREIRGEGLVGLARGFMYAGAERVVASLWRVQDRTTASLMKHFYRGLLQEGRKPADALRRAQLAIIDDPTGDFSFPYYWAGFVFQGDWR